MSFDPIARLYRTLEWLVFGDALHRCRVALLPELARPTRVLIVGEGDGRFLADFLRAFPHAKVDCVEASARMIALAQQRVERTAPAARVRFVHEEIERWRAPSARYDLIVTQFFLDCFAEEKVSAVVQKLSEAATPDATWLLSDFTMPTERLNRLRAAVLLCVMHVFFRIVAGTEAKRLLDVSPLLDGAEFHCAERVLSDRGFLKAELWQRA